MGNQTIVEKLPFDSINDTKRNDATLDEETEKRFVI